MKKCISFLVFLLLLGSSFALIGYGESNVFTITEETLPVQLSSFSATATAQNYVALKWVTESETALLGYRVYRSENSQLVTALLLTPEHIPATNTSTTQTYDYLDREVFVNMTYQYWLESVEMDGTSQFLGPISVVVTQGEDDTTPVVPMATELLNAYPNPFYNTTRINYYLVKDAAVIIDIYNVNGRLVRRFTNNGKAGYNWLNWDGKDNRATHCASGIYLVSLRSSTYKSTAKLMLVK